LLCRIKFMKNKTKICSGCKCVLFASVEYFYKSASSWDGLDHYCKKCSRENSSKFRKEHIEYYQQYHQEYYQKNKCEHQEKSKIYRQNNKDKIIKAKKEYYEANKERIKAKAKKYSEDNKVKKQMRDRQYRIDHKKERNKYELNKKNNNKEYKMICMIRAKVSNILKRHKAAKSDHTLNLIGCTIKQLIGYIESKFLPGMTWENYGLHGWHIDHIKPCISFNMTDPIEQQK